MTNGDARSDGLAFRTLGMWPAIAAVVIWVAAVGWPLVALLPVIYSLLSDLQTPIGTSSAVSGGSGGELMFHSMNALMTTSIAWSVAVALLSVLVGWLPGRWLGRLLASRGFVPAAALMAVPLCLPSYVIFYAWWQCWPAGTSVHRWVIENNLMQSAREATLLLALVCWSWPLVAMCVAASTARRPRTRDELLVLDGASHVTRILDRLRTDSGALALGAALVFLATLNNTTCFDLAEVFTFANELRARQALGASAAQTLQSALPMFIIAVIGAYMLWRALGCRISDVAWNAGRPSRWVALATGVIWLGSVAVPLAMFWSASPRRSQDSEGVAGQIQGGGWASGGLQQSIVQYIDLYASNTAFTIILACVSGMAAALVTLGLIMLGRSERVLARYAATIMSVTWVFCSLLPGTILGLALKRSWTDGVFAAAMDRSPIILNIAHLASAGLIPALFARWALRSEPKSLSDLRRLDRASGMNGIWKSSRPTTLASIAGSAVMVTTFAVGEITVTAFVVPPMPIDRTPLATTLLNEMHYQRPQTVMVASALLLSLAVIAACMLALAWRVTANFRFFGRISASSGISCFLCVVTLLAAGCSRSGSGEPQPLRVNYAFGAPGMSLGQFGYPRCLAIDTKNEFVYVIDKTARVQRFGFDGEPQLEWNMPEKENGKPTGITVGPDGRVYVADTHYFRVIVYDSNGLELFRFGEYGQGPGQFIYLTDVAVAADGKLFVAEYGGNDRIQVFSSQGEYLYEFGSFGRAEGQISRPQSLAFNADGTELYIADACNHRIVVTDVDGQWIRTFGTAGRAASELAYPYGLAMLPDGTLLVAEFGNNRIQRFSADGESLGVFGRVGRAEGELQYPWAVAAADDRIFVLDSGNNRVQVADMRLRH